MNRAISIAMVWLLLVVNVQAVDWPMYRVDSARSNYTPEQLPEGLIPLWTYQSPHAPRPAWLTRNRLQFDHAYQPVIAGEGIFLFEGKVLRC